MDFQSEDDKRRVEELKTPIEIPIQLQNPEFRFIKVKARDKTPLEDEWQKSANYKFDDPVILEHIRGFGNYGVVCGGSGPVVVDGDTREIREIMGKLKKTFKVATSVKEDGERGGHSYWDCPGFDKKIVLFHPTEKDKKGKPRHMGEIQTIGQQVIGPSCIHKTGVRYEVVEDLPIATITKEELLSAFSEYLEKPYEQLPEEAGETLSILKIVDTSKLTKRGDEWNGEHPIHGSETGHNFWVNEKKNAWHCFRCNTGGGPLSLIAVMEGILDCKDVKRGVLRGDVWKKIVEAAKKYGYVIDEINSENFFYEVVEGNKHYRKFSPEGFYEELSKKYRFLKIIGAKTLYYYKDGIWRESGEEIANRFLGSLGPGYRSNFLTSALGYINGACLEDNGFEVDKKLICLENGVLNTETQELLPWSDQYRFLGKLPIKYDPKATCPAIEKFLYEIVGEKDVPNILEMFGYCLYRGFPIQRNFMLVGDGRNGKSTLIKLFKAFLGLENIASISLQDINVNRFAAGALFGKMANLYADLPDSAVYVTGKFKMLTGGDPIDAEKKFGGWVHFENYAKFIFSCNKVPDAKDESGAYFSRWIIINFPHKFEGENCDRKMIDKITTPEELSGLLNLALKALQGLMKNGDFSNVKSTEETRDDYKRKASPVWAFVQDWIETDTSSEIPKDDLYEKYKRYCIDKGYPILANNIFSKELKKEQSPIAEGQTTFEKRGRLHVWKQIKLKEVAA